MTPEDQDRLAELQDHLIYTDPLYKQGFQAGAASRDAEIARLKSVPMKYRRMAFNAQLQNENAQLRAQIKMLQEALEKACARIEEHGFEIGEHWKIGREALNATKEQP